MKGRGLLYGILLALAACGLAPSNSQTPPEVLVTALGSATAAGISKGFSIPFGSSPVNLSSQSLATGDTLWGGTVVDNTLILLSRTPSGSGGEFLVSSLPLSSRGPAIVTGVSGTPYALAQSGQVIIVLTATSGAPQGCLETFSVGTLVSLSTAGGAISPLGSCQPLPGTGSLSGGLLLSMADGVEFLAGTLSGTTSAMDLRLYPLSTVIDGGSLASPQTTWLTSRSYPGGTPLSAVALSSTVLLPDPSLAAVDIYQVTTLYNKQGGTLTPLSTTSLSLGGPPTLLIVDPAQNFLMAASSGTVSLFGLGSVLNPPGTLGALGTIAPPGGLSLGALAVYAGSS